MTRIIVAILLLAAPLAAKTEFDELDKPPEGAHSGQMLLGATLSFGAPLGSVIDAEQAFLANNTYTFTDSETTKKLMVTHRVFAFGLMYEYMPLDFLGARAKFKYTNVVQSTIFGSQYENWSETLYSDFSFYLGPAFHLTTRKQWDVILAPVIGYSIAHYYATPIAARLVSGYTGDRTRSAGGLSYGAEVNFTAYFSGGLFISLGFDWTMNNLSFNPVYNLTQNNSTFFEGKNSSSIHSLSFVLTAGYAFSN